MIYLIAILIGLTIVVSMVQNSRLEQDIDIRQVTLLNFITGGVGSFILFFVSREALSAFAGLGEMPWYGYLGGLLGVVAVTFGTVVMKHVSVITASMLMYTGQMVIGVLIDISQGTDFSIGKIIGCLLIISGVYFNSFMDSLENQKSIPEV